MQTEWECSDGRVVVQAEQMYDAARVDGAPVLRLQAELGQGGQSSRRQSIPHG